MANMVIHRSNVPDCHIPTNLSFPEFIVKYNPELVSNDKLILEDHGAPHKRVTYGGLREEAAKIAAGYINLCGLEHGGRVAIISPNCVDWVLASIGAMWAGGVSV